MQDTNQFWEELQWKRCGRCLIIYTIWPDLTSSEYHLTTNMKKHRKLREFKQDSKLKENVTMYLK